MELQIKVLSKFNLKCGKGQLEGEPLAILYCYNLNKSAFHLLVNHMGVFPAMQAPQPCMPPLWTPPPCMPLPSHALPPPPPATRTPHAMHAPSYTCLPTLWTLAENITFPQLRLRAVIIWLQTSTCNGVFIVEDSITGMNIEIEKVITNGYPNLSSRTVQPLTSIVTFSVFVLRPSRSRPMSIHHKQDSVFRLFVRGIVHIIKLSPVHVVLKQWKSLKVW